MKSVPVRSCITVKEQIQVKLLRSSRRISVVESVSEKLVIAPSGTSRLETIVSSKDAASLEVTSLSAESMKVVEKLEVEAVVGR